MSTKELAHRLNKFEASATGAISNKIKERQRAGQTIFPLNGGEPDFDTPETAKRAGMEAIQNGFTKYTATNGVVELREAIAVKLAKDNGLQYSANEICVCTGAKQAIFGAIMALCDEGDEVLIPTPSWVSYSAMVTMSGATPVLVPSNADHSLDLVKIEAAITPRTRAVIICTPNNPSGVVYSEQSLRALAELAVRYDFFVISDEIYEKLIYDGYQHFSIASISREVWERTVTVNGFSKGYAMTGWRVGYAAARKDIIKAMIQIQGQVTSCATSIAQKAALGAMVGSQEATETMVKAFRERRDFVCRRLREIPHVSFAEPHGAFYVLVDISYYLGKCYDGKTVKTSLELAEFLLDIGHVGVVPGSAFGAEGTIRMAYAKSMDVLSAGLDAMDAALRLLV